MRIIAGRLKGRRLKVPKGFDVRPTSDKVKGALFSMMGEQIEGAAVMDLFAGTGNVGIEALSRGAASVLFVEHDPAAQAILAANLAICGMNTPQTALWKHGGVASLLSYLKTHPAHYDVIFADPPYHRPETFRLLRPFLRGLALAPGGRLVIEHSSSMPHPAPQPPIAHLRDYRYGDTSLAVYAREDEA